MIDGNIHYYTNDILWFLDIVIKHVSQDIEIQVASKGYVNIV